MNIVRRNPAWRTGKTYLGTNKDVFDTELYVIEKALGITSCWAGTSPPWTKVHVWADSQAVIRQLQHTHPGLGRWLVRQIVQQAREQVERGITVEVYWVSGHMSVEGTKKTAEAAKEAKERSGTRRCSERFMSLTHVGRTITERN